MSITSPAAIIRAAQVLIAGQAPPNLSDPDSLTDAQLVELSGFPAAAHGELERWDWSGQLPASVDGLGLLAMMIEHTWKARRELTSLTDVELEAIARSGTQGAGPLTDDELQAIARKGTAK